MDIRETDGITFLDYNGNDTADGGYHDVCNSLLQQIKHVEMKYKDQLAGLKLRKQKLKESIADDVRASIICLLIIAGLVGFTKFLELVRWSGIFAIIYVFIKLLLPASAVVILFFFLPVYLRRLDLNIRNNHIMNERFDDEILLGRDVVTFKQEERHIKDRLREINLAREEHDKVEESYLGRFDEEWDDVILEDVSRLRKVSVYRELYARGIKKDSGVKQAWIGVTVCLLAMFGAVILLA